MRKLYTPRELLPAGLVVALTLFCSFIMPSFIRMGNLMNILKQSAFTGMLAVGMLFVFIVGEVDLSVGSQFAFYGMLCAYLMQRGLPVAVAIAATLLISLLIGAGIGYCISRIQAKALLATIAVSVAIQGLTYMVARGVPIFHIPASLADVVRVQVAGVSMSVVLMLVVGMLGAFILQQTYHGKYLYAVGNNSYAAEKSGISVRGSKMLAFSLCSLFTCVSGVVYLGRIGSASFVAGSGAELDVLTAAALAGVSLNGGKGKVFPVFCGAVFLGVLSSAFIALNVAPYYQNVIKGIILFCAILTNRTKP